MLADICVHDVFLVCNYGILPFWALLIISPQGEWTNRLVHSLLVPVVLATVYIWAFVVNQDSPVDAGFTSLAGVMIAFTSPWVALAGWVHYLIFDLFIGAWEARDAARRGIRHAYIVPSLLLTLLLGPAGLASYLLLRFALVRATTLGEAPTSDAVAI